MILDFKFDTTNNNNNLGNNDGICNDDENCLTFTCKDGNCINPQIDLDPNNNNNNGDGDNGGDENDNSASSPFIDSLKCKDKGDSTEDNPNPCADVSMQCLLEHDGIITADGEDGICNGKAYRLSGGSINLATGDVGGSRYYPFCDDTCEYDSTKYKCKQKTSILEAVVNYISAENNDDFDCSNFIYENNEPVSYNLGDVEVQCIPSACSMSTPTATIGLDLININNIPDPIRCGDIVLTTGYINSNYPLSSLFNDYNFCHYYCINILGTNYELDDDNDICQFFSN